MIETKVFGKDDFGVEDIETLAKELTPTEVLEFEDENGLKMSIFRGNRNLFCFKTQHIKAYAPIFESSLGRKLRLYPDEDSYDTDDFSVSLTVGKITALAVREMAE